MPANKHMKRTVTYEAHITTTCYNDILKAQVIQVLSIDLLASQDLSRDKKWKIWVFFTKFVNSIPKVTGQTSMAYSYTKQVYIAPPPKEKDHRTHSSKFVKLFSQTVGNIIQFYWKSNSVSSDENICDNWLRLNEVNATTLWSHFWEMVYFSNSRNSLPVLPTTVKNVTSCCYNNDFSTMICSKPSGGSW